MDARVSRVVGEGGEEGKEMEAEAPWVAFDASYFCISSKN